MVCCGAKGHLRKSKNGLKHFYHGEKNEECGGEPESLDHLKLKYQIYQICKSEGWHAQPEYESPSGDWRADVFAEKDERKVVFEIQLSIITLDVLKEREAKYHRDGIESYWILKDFMKISPYDNPKFVAGGNRGVFIDTYLNEGEFCLNREEEFLIEHGIRTIGIDPNAHCLYTADIIGIDISEWIRSVLTGEYKKSLKDFETNYRNKLSLRELARPELNKIGEFADNKFEYDEQMKKIYAIFKNNKWDNFLSLKQEISGMYDSFKTFDASRRKLVSPKNGFVWKDYMHLGHEEPLLNLISENQISSLHNLILNVEEEEKKFLSYFNSVKQQIEQKDAENNQKTDQSFFSPKPEFQEPEYYRNKKEYRKEILKEIKPEIKTYDEISTPAAMDVPGVENSTVIFEFFPILPSLLIESQRGWKYQNPAGCVWEINKTDAIEFEMKEYGKILKKIENCDTVNVIESNIVGSFSPVIINIKKPL